MTARARGHISQIVTAECARAVVTGSTIISSSLMFLRLDSRHLSALRCISSYGMAIGAVQPLGTRMVAVAEDRFEDVSSGWRPAVWGEFMTDIARTDLAFGGVTHEACRVRPDPDRYRLTRARGIVTCRAAFLRQTCPRIVRGVHELHIEALDEPRREFLHRRRHSIHVVVADRAHRLLFRICELAYVTSDTRLMSRVFEIERLTFAPVARVAVELLVFRDPV